MSASVRPRGFHHHAIQVRDLERAARFYREVLGLPELRRLPAREGTGDRAVWLDAGDGRFIALEAVPGGATAAEDPARAERPGHHLLALSIRAGERSAWQVRLAAAGVAVVSQTDFTLYVRDPEGNMIGLSHHPDQARPSDPAPPSAPPASSPRGTD